MLNSQRKKNTNQSGSSHNGEPEFVCVGKIHRAHGIEGAVVFNPMTDFPERIRRGKILLVGDEKTPLTVQTIRQKPPYLLINFAEINNVIEATRFRNQFVFVPVASLPPLPPGEYYFHQLLGLTVAEPSGDRLGILADIIETGANDVYVIELIDGTRKLVADIPDNILKIDIDAGQIVIRIPEEY